jgi:hypothetical protein
VLGEFDDDISELENDENQIGNDQVYKLNKPTIFVFERVSFQYKQVLQIKSTMNRILQDNYKTASRLEKVQ